MSKISKNYRLNEVTVKMIDEISCKSDYSSTDIVQMAVSLLYNKYMHSTWQVPDTHGEDLLLTLAGMCYCENLDYSSKSRT